jgi:deazaflavin-dependent oxidoreductase (nitroreductase family)
VAADLAQLIRDSTGRWWVRITSPHRRPARYIPDDPVGDEVCDGMVVSKRVGRFNRAVTNRLTRPFVGRLPWFGIVQHRGRRSGRIYRTPVNAFSTDGGYVIALIYGAGADWVRNVTAAGGCELRVRGRQVRLTEPRIVHDDARREVPQVVRPALRLLGVADFLYLRAKAGATDRR